MEPPECSRANIVLICLFRDLDVNWSMGVLEKMIEPEMEGVSGVF